MILCTLTPPCQWSRFYSWAWLRPWFEHCHRLWIVAVVLFGPLLLIATDSHAETLQSITNPKRASNTWISDMAHVFDSATERRLNALLNQLERQTDAEMAVVAIRRTDGSTPKKFATNLFNRWGIGKQGRDNGVLMLLVMDDRRIEVETGRGMGRVLPDSLVQEILNQQVVPRFREDDYAGGVEAGVQALVQRIEQARLNSRKSSFGTTAGDQAARTSQSNRTRLDPDRSFSSAESRRVIARANPSPAATRHSPNTTSGPFDTIGESSPPRPAPPMPLWALAGGALLLPMGGWLALRSRIRHCPQCQAKMRRLSESEDDALLAFDQQFEENLGSVDYRVWRCNTCQTTTVERANKWFSGYENCPQCRHRTVASQTTILRHPTYTHTGESMVTLTCRFPNCGYQNQQRRLLPVKQRPSTTHRHTSHHTPHSTCHGISHSSHSSSGVHPTPVTLEVARRAVVAPEHRGKVDVAMGHKSRTPLTLIIENSVIGGVTVLAYPFQSLSRDLKDDLKSRPK